MINCLIIEDEPLAADILIDYVKQVQHLRLVGVASHALEGLDFLSKHQVDLIFLDIHLPGLKGLDFLKALPNPPAVILTTAYQEYALESYEFNVIDYLLKPIEFNRFLRAVGKLKQTVPIKDSNKFKFISESKTHLIQYSDILFIESKKEYVHIYTSDKVFISKMTLHSVESQLRSDYFIRIHRSFIVSIEKIKSFNASEVEIASNKIPIGGNYRESVLRILEK